MKTRTDGREEITVGWANDGEVTDRRTGHVVQITRAFSRRINAANVGDEIYGYGCQCTRIAAVILQRLS